MRVITGKYKGKRFDVPRTFRARPTTDCAKENIFNVLRAYVDFEETAALDLFGGTGSISLELVSRGCTRVTTVEMYRPHFVFIKKVMQELGEDNWDVLQADVLKYVKRCRGGYDLVFADPPYQLAELQELPDRVLNSETIREEGLFVLEHGKKDDFHEHPCFVEHRAYGSVNFSIFRKSAKRDGE